MVSKLLLQFKNAVCHKWRWKLMHRVRCWINYYEIHWMKSKNHHRALCEWSSARSHIPHTPWGNKCFLREMHRQQKEDSLCYFCRIRSVVTDGTFLQAHYYANKYLTNSRFQLCRMSIKRIKSTVNRSLCIYLLFHDYTISDRSRKRGVTRVKALWIKSDNHSFSANGKQNI
jgi:hypothetical protein